MSNEPTLSHAWRLDRLTAEGTRPARLQVPLEACRAERVAAREEEHRPLFFPRHQIEADGARVRRDVLLEKLLDLRADRATLHELRIFPSHLHLQPLGDVPRERVKHFVHRPLVAGFGPYRGLRLCPVFLRSPLLHPALLPLFETYSIHFCKNRSRYSLAK